MDTNPLFLPKSGNLPAGLPLGDARAVDAVGFERAPGVDTLLEGIQANSQELPALMAVAQEKAPRDDAFAREARRQARRSIAEVAADAGADGSSAKADRMERTSPAILLASSGVSSAGSASTASKTVAPLDAVGPSAGHLDVTFPGTRQRRRFRSLAVLTGICALIASGAVWGGLLKGRDPVDKGGVVVVTALRSESAAPTIPSAPEGEGTNDEATIASESALAELRAEAASQLAQEAKIERAEETSSPPASAPASRPVRRASRVEPTRALSTIPPRSDISRSQ